MKFLFKWFFVLLIISLSIFNTGCNGSGGGSGSNISPVSSQKAMTAYALNGTPGVISGQNISISMPYGTDITALIATFTTTGASVSIGNTVQTSGMTQNNFTNPIIYTVTAANGSTINYTVTVRVAQNNEKAITAYSLNGTPGVISGQNIAVTMPYETDIKALTATFTTTGTSVSIGNTVQTSGATPNDFTNPIIYTVTAANGSTLNYTVIVTVVQSNAKTITAYSLNGTPGVINGQNIVESLPYGTDVTLLTATFTTTGASVSIGNNIQTSGATPNDFTNPVIYTVTAADGSTANYTVTVTVAAGNAKAITAYALNGIPGVINGQNIVESLPFGTDITALTATFTTTGASVIIGNTVQTSGATPNDFTNPVIYKVIAADGSAANYTVTVTAPANPTFFTCVADGSDACGCLIQNDGTPNPLMWYRYGSTNAFNFSYANIAFIQGFNAAGHCGYNDWRVPTIITTTSINNAGSAYFGESGLTGDFASLASYANQHGYTYKDNLGYWLATNGFSHIVWGTYWSSSLYLQDGGHAWAAIMLQGFVSTPEISTSSGYILPVRGGN